MAKRSTGPVVATQMPSMGPKRPSLTPSGGVYDHNHAPFDKPHDTGNGGIPTKFFDDTHSPTVARTTVSGSGIPASNLASPHASGGQPRSREKAKVPGNNK